MYVAVVVPTYVDWIVKLFVSDLEVTSRPTKANVIKLFSRKGLCAKSLTNLLILFMSLKTIIWLKFSSVVWEI